jgi:hypothetical protein
MDCMDLVESSVRERIREPIEIGNHVGGRANNPVDSNGTSEFIQAAPDIECSRSLRMQVGAWDHYFEYSIAARNHGS